jgi:hypothetical protein
MTGPDSADGVPATDAEVLREEIRRTRADLGETVQALAAKADVRARLRQSAAGTADRVRNTMRDPRRTPIPWIALAAGTAVLVVLIVTRGRRR